MKQRFGICEWSFPVSGPLAIRLAQEAGYEGIQLGEGGGRRMGYPLKHPRVQAIYRETADQWGITLHSLNMGALLADGAMNHPAGTEMGKSARESLEAGFEVCCRLELRTIVLTLDPKSEEAFENVICHLSYASELAKDSGVEIAIESALPLADIQRILRNADQNVKICMDLLNPLRFGTGNPQEQIRAFGREKISHFHIKDSISSLFQPGQRGCVPLGRGDAGYEASVSAIKEIDYQGWMIIENYYYLPPMNSGREDFVALAACDLETMKRSFRL